MVTADAVAEDQPWWPQAQAMVSALLHELGADLAGVYVHGSAALGGWVPTSDLDVLAVVSDNATSVDWRSLGSRLLDVALDTPVLEMSIVTVRASTEPGPPWPFLVHVAQGGDKVVLDEGHGDPDLLMHYVVSRRPAVRSLASWRAKPLVRCHEASSFRTCVMSWRGVWTTRMRGMRCSTRVARWLM